MIVDLHTHLLQSPDQLGPVLSAAWRNRFARGSDPLDAGPQAHEAAVAPVDVAVVLGFRSKYLQAAIPNKMIAEYVKRRPNELIGFAGIDPMDRGYLEEFETARSSGLGGITISPSAQDYHPLDTRAMRLYEKCEKLRLPIMFHQSEHYTPYSKLEYARPYLLDEVARSFPELRILIAHCGHPWIDETLVLIGKHPHVYAELGSVTTRPWQLYTTLLMAYQMDVIDQLLFGSDFPSNTPHQAIETIYSLNQFSHRTTLPTVPREKLRAIVERDALPLLGIGADIKVTRPAEPEPEIQSDPENDE